MHLGLYYLGACTCLDHTLNFDFHICRNMCMYLYKYSRVSLSRAHKCPRNCLRWRKLKIETKRDKAEKNHEYEV